MFNSKIFSIILTVIFLSTSSIFAAAQDKSLPDRKTPIPETTNGVPHIQLGLQITPAMAKELLSYAANLPGVTVRDTVISLPGARGFWLSKDIKVARPEVIVGGREFAHMHPDGSLHASLNPKTARAAVKAGWATPHPWANKRKGWEGFVMIFTPTNASELDVVLRLIDDSYQYVTGTTLPSK
jgi:phospholipase/carboxylesterase